MYAKSGYFFSSGYSPNYTSFLHFWYTAWGSDLHIWVGGEKDSGLWKWPTTGDVITTWPGSQPDSDSSHIYSILDEDNSFSLASSPDDMLYALCEGTFKTTIC